MVPFRHCAPQEAEERARKLFSDKVSRLHHLVSTATQPGIFSSPYAVAAGTLPVIMGLPVEDHLRAATKAAVGGVAGCTGVSVGSGRLGHSQQLAGSGGHGSSGRLPPLRSGSASKGRSVSGGRGKGAEPYPSTVEVAGRVVPARFTLRQTAEYDAVRRDELLNDKIHRAEVGVRQGRQARRTRARGSKSPGACAPLLVNAAGFSAQRRHTSSFRHNLGAAATRSVLVPTTIHTSGHGHAFPPCVPPANNARPYC